MGFETKTEEIAVICAWCGEDKGTKEVNRCETMAGVPTHTICEECKERTMSAYEDQQEELKCDEVLVMDVQYLVGGTIHNVLDDLHGYTLAGHLLGKDLPRERKRELRRILRDTERKLRDFVSIRKKAARHKAAKAALCNS